MTFIDFDVCNLAATLPAHSVAVTYFFKVKYFKCKYLKIDECSRKMFKYEVYTG